MQNGEEIPPGRRRFETTRWSVVVAAGAHHSAQAECALATLCDDYWYPLYAYVRRRGYDADDARDLTQDFFAKFLTNQGFATADRTRGRFRTFLLTSMQNFLASEWRRRSSMKRGGHVDVVPIDYEDAERRYSVEPSHTLTPEAIYERRWALALIARALDDLRTQYADRGQTDLFEALHEQVGNSGHTIPYRDLSKRLGRSEASLRTASSRLRSRWRARLRALVAETVHEHRLVEDELTMLLRALAPGSSTPVTT